jgi:hypothetical protein
VDPVPDPLLLIKCGSTGNRTQDLLILMFVYFQYKCDTNKVNHGLIHILHSINSLHIIKDAQDYEIFQMKIININMTKHKHTVPCTILCLRTSFIISDEVQYNLQTKQTLYES